jgi:glycosyltransferase involved in cell wall biosynthesis
MSSNMSSSSWADQARAINRAFAVREAALVAELEAIRESNRRLQQNLTDCEVQLSGEVEQRQALAIRLAESEHLLAEHLASISEQTRVFAAREAALLSELDASRHSNHLAQQELTDRTTQLSSQAEQQDALAARLAESVRSLTEQLRASSEQAHAFTAREAVLIAELQTAQECNRRLQQELTNRVAQLSGEAERQQAVVARLAESERSLSEQLRTSSEQVGTLQERNKTNDNERALLWAELEAIRVEASKSEARAFEAIQTVVKNLASEHRQTIESLDRSASERERTASTASRVLEQELRHELARMYERRAQLLARVDQLQSELDTINRTWFSRLLGSERAKGSHQRLPLDFEDDKGLVTLQSPQPAVRTSGPEERPPPEAIGSGPDLLGADSTGQTESSSRESKEIIMPIDSLESNLGSGPSLDALLKLQGAAFLESAYLAILRRRPDAEGSRFFLKELESGVSKLVVLRRLIESDEARVRLIEHAELSAEIQRRMPKWLVLRGRISRAVRRKKIQSDLLTNVLARNGQDFLRAAYRALLRREPDESGLKFYLDELLAGHSKIDVLGRIYNSAERRKLGTDIPGLPSRLRRQRVARMPMIGEIARRRQSEGYAASDFLLRRLEQRIEILNDGLETLVANTRSNGERIERHLFELASRLERQSSGRPPEIMPAAVDLDSGIRTPRLVSVTADQQPKITRTSSRAPLLPVVYFYVDHTAQCPVNTGMQRVVRRLGRALLEKGQITVFVKWDPALKGLILASQEDLIYLGKWNGPQFSEAQLKSYPLAQDGARPISRHKTPGSWLLVPEVTHITYHAQPVTLDVLLAARQLNLSISFVYYDAIPLRLPSYKDTAQRHELYMQQLLLADVIIPISERSAIEIDRFFRSYQSNTAPRPTVCALPLPAESQLTARLFATDTSMESRTILCVGSIEPRKNQIALLEAFESLSNSQPNFAWKLILAGNLRGDVAAKVMEYIGRNRNISHVQNIPDPELDALYRACSFTVFPSVEEGFGLPILESLWYAKPCVCANFGAMAEVAEGGGCYGVDTRSAYELRIALEQMTGSADLRSRLSVEASQRPLTTWSNYSDSVTTLLQNDADPVQQIGRIYYWIDNTAINPSNSGIQRVTRQLAKALMTLGVELIPVRWNSSTQRLVETGKLELEHLALWEGPEPSGWSPWIDPTREPGISSWLLIPELTHGELSRVKQYARSAGLQCAALFYDSIPYKFKSDYGHEFGQNHQDYMLELFGFDAVFPISEFSREDLLTFYISKSDIRSIALDQRIKTKSLPDEFASSPRQRLPKEKSSSSIHMLSVVSMEPRKNILTMLTAFQYAQRRAKAKLHLTLVGRHIPAFAGLAQEVERRIGDMEGVVWEQDVNDVRLNELYRACDFTVFPSLEEGFGLPIVESLWNGRPCICHNDGAMREVAQGGGCMLVDMRDAHLLSDVILNLAESPNARVDLAKEACDRPVRSWSEYGADILATLVELLPPTLAKSAPPVSELIGLYHELPNLQRRPLLTVAISTYNRAGWLAVALRNLARLIPTPHDDIEILVCDNCSTDHTPEVVEPYTSRIDFKYIRNPENVGMLGNLRITSNSARGEYIWILGDDDLPFAGSIDRIVRKIKENRDAALIYLNYTYTRETDPKSVSNLDEFLSSGILVAPPTPDQVAPVKDIATVNENLFTAIYCIIFRRDHALRAYCQDTSGRPFSTMLTSIPTTAHVLNNMMNEKAVWIGEPQVLVNFNVSWNSYASLQILERVPEALDLAELNGANSEGIDKLRKNLIPGYIHYFNEIYGDDTKSNHEYFSILRVISRIRHLDIYGTVAPELAKIYAKAYAAGHAAAKIDPNRIFENHMQH